MHLLKWEVLTKPKEYGRATLRKAREMNWALLAKLAWKVMTSEGQTWCDVLRSKYGVKNEGRAHFRDRQRSSQIWKEVSWGAELLRKGPLWEVRNGRSAFFWKDV